MIENGDKCFSFAYDCGSSGDKANLYHRVDEFIETLPDRKNGKKHLDMLILSHYHRDHINGIEYLFERVEVSLAVIPYNPDEYLTLFALDSRVAEEPDDFILDFHSDRFSFLKAHGVDTIIELGKGTDESKDSFDFSFGEGVTLSILGASRKSKYRYTIDADTFFFSLSLIKDAEVFIPMLNRSSLMCFHYPENEPSKGYFLTGDVPLMDEWEQQLFPEGLNAGDEIYHYQIPHHGAKEVYPHPLRGTIGLVSVGEHNIYNHPDEATIDKILDSFSAVIIMFEDSNFSFPL